MKEFTIKDRIQFIEDRRKLRNDVRASLVQGLAGSALLLGLLFTWQQQQATSRQFATQLEVTWQGQIGERFSRAVEQLGNPMLHVRVGGVYELEQIALQAEDRRAPIAEVLSAFVRRDAPASPTFVRPNEANTGDPESNRITVDVQAAVAVLAQSPRRPESFDRWPQLFPDDRSRVFAWPIDLYGANLALAELTRANLSFAKMDNVDLRGAVLFDANLSWAKLRYADLRGADLKAADMSPVGLFGADLRDAKLSEARITSSGLSEADLRGADLSLADLSGSGLALADLRGADLRGAKLQATQLDQADLRGADLTGADLTGATLTGARADIETTWPAGFDWRKAGVVMDTP